MKNIIVVIAALALGGCATSRPASPVRTPHTAPVAGAPYSRIIYVQKSNESTFVPPKVGGSTASPKSVKPALPFPDLSVPSEDCPDGQCKVPGKT